MADDPSTIGRYRIVGRLGEGGMGIVYAAEDVDLQRPVAIKTVRDGSAIDRLRREVRTAASVNHPNICPIYEIGEQDGVVFIVMERLEGESLATRLERGPLTADDSAAVALGILEGLSALHQRGIVHRARPSMPRRISSPSAPSCTKCCRARPRSPASRRCWPLRASAMKAPCDRFSTTTASGS